MKTKIIIGILIESLLAVSGCNTSEEICNLNGYYYDTFDDKCIDYLLKECNSCRENQDKRGRGY